MDINKRKHIEIGDKFGKLTVIEEAGWYIQPSGQRKKLFKCKCDCGNIKNIREEYLKSGHTKSCGHCNYIPINIGDKYNKLTVIEKADDYINPTTGKHASRWKCKCDCGNITIVNEYDLKSGNTKSCGYCNYIPINIGDKFGKLTVIEKADDYIRPNKIHEPRWKCKCDCGNITIVNEYALKSGKTKSCGCLVKNAIIIANTKHGLSDTRIYHKYYGMIYRCYNPNSDRYSEYGGRGITICDEWLDKDNGFINFYNWAISHGYRDDLEIDRINVNGNYEPNNCRWIPKEYQYYNKRDSRKIYFNGEKITIPQLANILGITSQLLRYRLEENNWDLSSLFTYITDQYGNTKAYLLDIHKNPISINIIYFIDEYGFPISQDKINE